MIGYFMIFYVALIFTYTVIYKRYNKKPRTVGSGRGGLSVSGTHQQVYFTRGAQFSQEAGRFANNLRPDLLILDDFGLKPIQPPGPEDLYDVINERYERSSILLTSNRAPNEWPDLFLDPLLASAGLDRLLDRAEVVIIRGTSYRAQGRTRLLEDAPPA
jgi:hypothetical protein